MLLNLIKRVSKRRKLLRVPYAPENLIVWTHWISPDRESAGLFDNVADSYSWDEDTGARDAQAGLAGRSDARELRPIADSVSGCFGLTKIFNESST